jgi:YggT family protein
VFTLIQLVQLIFQLFTLLIIARVLFSWIQISDPKSPFYAIQRFVYNATEPILAPVRQLMPRSLMLDLSPLVVLIGAWVVERILISILIGML